MAFTGKFWPIPKFWILTIFLAITMLIGGGSRNDIMSLAVLRPLSVLVLAWGLFLLSWTDIKQYRMLFIIAVLIVLSVLLQLVPLPPAIWQSLPGRELARQVEEAANIQSVWRPISLDVAGTYNAFFSLIGALAVLVFGVQLSGRDRSRLTVVFLVMGLISSIVGTLQIIGPPNGPFYFYRITNNDVLVGLFSNRNHMAVFLACLIPLIAFQTWSAFQEGKNRQLAIVLGFAAGLSIVPLVLLTGSRAGLVAMIVAAISTISLLGAAKNGFSFRVFVLHNKRYFILGCLAFLAIIIPTIISSRAFSIERTLSEELGSEMRFSVWGPIWEMAVSYFPTGSGYGSFVDIYKVSEPNSQLGFNYLNHAHNDWLEVVLTGGLPATLILGLAVAIWFVRACNIIAVSRSGVSNSSHLETYMTRLGLIVTLILALASLVDYPLRVPALQCLFVIAVLWMHD